MFTHDGFDVLPLGWFFIVTIFLVLFFIEVGYRLGRWRRSRNEQEKEAPVGAMVGTMLGLLAFMMTFTFGFATSRFDARRQVLLEEANAIGTAYLRADFLAEPRRSESKSLLTKYVDLRLEAANGNDLSGSIGRSEELHQKLWVQAVSSGETNPGSIVVGLYIQSLNEVIDLHAKRVQVALRSRIRTTIWTALFLIAMLAMTALGYHT